MVALGWTVLALVFLDELLAMAAAGVWGRHTDGVLLAVLMPLAVVVVWFLFASPRAVAGRAPTRHTPPPGSHPSPPAGHVSTCG